jgi:hypothetical protein
MAMQPKWNPSGRINWKQLDRDLIKNWYATASTYGGVHRLLFSYICLNHYYTAWAEVSLPVNDTDREMMRNLSKLPIVIEKWQEFTKMDRVNGVTVNLPLKNRQNGNVPKTIILPKSYQASDLTIEDFLEVIYQVRFDLFSAQKNAISSRDPAAVELVTDASFKLVTILISDTVPNEAKKRGFWG